MGARFVCVDHDTPLLMPPDLREWVPGDHLVHFIMEAVGLIDLREAKINERGTGSRQYPPALYVREGRRLRGDYVLSELDCRGMVTVEDSVGLGSFIMDSHIVRRIIYKTDKDAHITHLRTSMPDEITEGQRNWTGDMVGVEGQFDSSVPKPYRISYRCLRPKKSDCINLLVPTVIPSTHVGFGSSRMEPVFMILGQSAGAAASLAIDESVAVQDVDYAKLRELLLKEGQLLE